MNSPWLVLCWQLIHHEILLARIMHGIRVDQASLGRGLWIFRTRTLRLTKGRRASGSWPIPAPNKALATGVSLLIKPSSGLDSESTMVTKASSSGESTKQKRTESLSSSLSRSAGLAELASRFSVLSDLGTAR